MLIYVGIAELSFCPSSTYLGPEPKWPNSWDKPWRTAIARLLGTWKDQESFLLTVHGIRIRLVTAYLTGKNLTYKECQKACRPRRSCGCDDQGIIQMDNLPPDGNCSVDSVPMQQGCNGWFYEFQSRLKTTMVKDGQAGLSLGVHRSNVSPSTFGLGMGLTEIIKFRSLFHSQRILS